MTKFKYPSDREVQEHISKIKEHKIRVNMPPEVVKACETLSAYFYAAIPYYDLYEMYCQSNLSKVSEDDLRKAYGEQWDTLPQKLKNKVYRERDKVEKGWQESLQLLGEFINRQAQHTADLADDKIEKLEQIAESVAA